MGTLHGVGLGPGDPDLLSLRAHRLVSTTRHIAYFRKRGRPGQARRIVDGMLRADAVEYPMEYPVTTEIALTDPAYNATLGAFYDACAAHLQSLIAAGEDVVVLCEGDPFFYGSYMHLHSRLAPRVPVQVTPAITGMSAAWTATGAPITWGDDVLTVLMGTLPEEVLARRIADTDALVVMKIGRNLPRLRRALATAGRLGQAWLVIEAAMAGQQVMPLSDAPETIPYFSIVVIHGQGRRP